MTGSVVGFGVKRRLTERLSVALVYRRSDCDEVGFFDTARVTNLRLGGESESGRYKSALALLAAEESDQTNIDLTSATERSAASP